MLRAWTLFALTRFAEVAPRLAEAFNLYLSVGDIAHAVDAAEFATYPQGAERLPREQIRGLREQALALVPPESPEAARLLCALAETYSYAHRGRAEECLARATELARRFADRRLEARISYTRAWLQYRNLEWPALLESASAALDAARAIGDRDRELLFGGRLVLWRLLCGDPAGAEELARELRGTGEMRPSLWTDDLQSAERVLAIWTGRWRELGRRLEERKWLTAPGTVAGPARRPAPAKMVAYHTPELMLAYIEGHPQLYINPDHLAMRANMLADACADQGNQSALPAVREVAERALSMELSPLGRLFAQAALGFVGYLQQDAALLERACGPEMLSAPGDVIMESPGCLLDSVRGLVFGLAGRDEEARVCFERALAMSQRCGLVYNSYHTRVYYAAFLVRRGELRRARELAEEARRAGAGLGLEGQERELAEVMSRLEGALPDGLTAREVDVLSLAARGLATKQIAAELSISYFTAANHLRHLYAKTGVRCRVDLAAYALRHHLGGHEA
jgi:DNA-binding CsgD family transcriptional regulator